MKENFPDLEVFHSTAENWYYERSLFQNCLCLYIHVGPVGDYRLPFEDEVGLHPSLEDMQQAVSQKKIRPRIRDDWRLHSVSACFPRYFIIVP